MYFIKKENVKFLNYQKEKKITTDSTSNQQPFITIIFTRKVRLHKSDMIIFVIFHQLLNSTNT